MLPMSLDTDAANATNVTDDETHKLPLKAADSYRVWPLGQQPAVRPDEGMLNDEQVLTCASVLLYAMLSEAIASNVWVTDLANLQSLRESGCPDDLKKWLQESNVTVYVIACLGPYGFVNEGDGHWICLSIVSPSPETCTVIVYDSRGYDSIYWRWDSLKAEVAETTQWISKAKFESAPTTTRARLEPVHLDDVQSDNINCGFHVALFIASDVARRESDGVEYLKRFAWLRNCPSNAEVLRRWMEQYAFWFDEPNHNWGAPPDKAAATLALEQLFETMVPFEVTQTSTVESGSEIQLCTFVQSCMNRCCRYFSNSNQASDVRTPFCDAA